MNYSRSKQDINVNEECQCGERETVEHFLLECARFERAREELMADVRTVWDKVINEDVLLGGGGITLAPEKWQVIVSAVEKYVLSTKRSI